MSENVTIRPATIADEPVLWAMLYQAIYIPPGATAPPRDILHRPELSRYVEGWGAPDDIGFVAKTGGRPVGAAWLRLLIADGHGYGYVDDKTPELSMAVALDYRGQGIGTRLLARLMEEAAGRYPAVSLSVAADNPAVRLYERFGFMELDNDGGSLTMIRHFVEPSV